MPWYMQVKSNQWPTQPEPIVVLHSMKPLRVLLLPPGWDATSLQGYSPPPNISSSFPNNSLVLIYTPE